MIRQSIVSYYAFGTQMRYLQDVSVGTCIKDDDYILDNINRFLNNLNSLGLVVTNRAAFKLFNFKDKLTETENAEIDAQQSEELSKIMNDLRLTLDAEIIGIYAFTTTPK